ncbi:MAG: ubiquinone biosynthesis protein UbiB, partial [Betaproteobacteria bacterium]|nr:ubiquinone biosynthesis protein UbiB [Betaproteobacteria bacterium]
MRLIRVGFVLAREGAFALVDPREAPPGMGTLVRIARLFERRGAASNAEGLVAALTRLGPSYIKLGQFMATRPDVVGVRVARDLERLQDRIPPFGRAAAVKEIEASFGKSLDAIFSDFSEPIAAASIAQVHRARTVTGETVAVKVLRPGVRTRFRRDLAAMAYAAEVMESLSAEARRLKFVDVVETLKRSVTMEMDLRLEAAALSEMAENARDDAEFHVPSVSWDLTARDVVTMEWIDGIPLHDLD